MTELNSQKKIPLEWAATALTTLSQQIEDGLDVDAAIVRTFEDAKLSVTEAIDRRKAFKSYLLMMIDRCKAAKAEVNDRQKFFERTLERLTEQTKRVIEENPGVPYTDSLGAKVSVVKNGQPRLELKIPLAVSKSISSVVDHEQCEFFGVDRKYLKTVSYLVLDTEAVKNDLKSGAILEWAELIWGSQLRGL
jgi:hypothetical protein